MVGFTEHLYSILWCCQRPDFSLGTGRIGVARVPVLTLSSGQKLTFLSVTNLVGYTGISEMTALRDKLNFRGARKLCLVPISRDTRDIENLQNPEPPDIV